MDGTFGTEIQQARQAKSDTLAASWRNRAGGHVGGRGMATDDPAALGWDVVDEHFREDGVFSFRFADPATQAEVRDYAEAHGARVDEWLVFIGGRDAGYDAVHLAHPELPEGMTWVDDDDPGDLDEWQRFLDAVGIAPLSQDMLAGRIVPSALRGIRGPDGALAATSFAAQVGGIYGDWADCAWVGLVAVAEEHRGRGLGVRVDAAAVLAALDLPGIRRVAQFAAADNAAGIRVIERCGMRPTELRNLVVTRDPDRITR